MSVIRAIGKYISFGVFAILLGQLKGCFYYLEMTHLSDEELQWIDCVEKYPEPRFVSADGDTAYLFYDKVKVWNDTTRFHFEISSNFQDTYSAAGYYEYHIRNISDTIRGKFQIEKPVETEKLEIYACLNDLWTGKKRDICIPLRTTTFKLRGTLYDNCIVCDSTNTSYGGRTEFSDKNKITSFVINREYGLIYYQYSDGREFFRIMND